MYIESPAVAKGFPAGTDGIGVQLVVCSSTLARRQRGPAEARSAGRRRLLTL